ncbi:MAG: hypothetical protein WKF85_04160 [Chitinophagaceae bacterium]
MKGTKSIIQHHTNKALDDMYDQLKKAGSLSQEKINEIKKALLEAYPQAKKDFPGKLIIVDMVLFPATLIEDWDMIPLATQKSRVFDISEQDYCLKKALDDILISFKVSYIKDNPYEIENAYLGWVLFFDILTRYCDHYSYNFTFNPYYSTIQDWLSSLQQTYSLEKLKIRNDLLLVRNGEENKSDGEISRPVVALIHVYLKEENKPGITDTNKNIIAQEFGFGHSAGRKIKEMFDELLSDNIRLNKSETLKPHLLKKRLADITTAYNYIGSQFPRAKEKARLEIEFFNTKFKLKDISKEFI